jgi:uncharacterized protein (DUF427 family)
MPSSAAFGKHPQYKITISPHNGLILVLFNGIEVARTDQALRMAEGKYPVVYYIPFEDCRKERFIKTDHSTFCPFKGTASYWTLQADSGQSESARSENSVWGYEDSYDEVAAISGHVAFYADRVDIQVS